MNLTAARLNKGLTTREVAETLGMSHGTLLRAERGSGVRPAHAKKIADFYGVQVTDIWPVDEPNRSAA